MPDLDLLVNINLRIKDEIRYNNYLIGQILHSLKSINIINVTYLCYEYLLIFKYF